jgi:hypothetical protein
MVIFRFVASHTIIGSFTEISTLSGMLCAKIVQNHSHMKAKTLNISFFILRMMEIKLMSLVIFNIV